MQVPTSPEIDAILDFAASLSMRRKDFFVGVEHVFEALVENNSLLPKGVGPRYLKSLQSVLHELHRDLWGGSFSAAATEVFYTPRCAQITSDAARIAGKMRYTGPRAGHLLLAMLADALSGPSRAMDRLGIKRGELLQELRSELIADRPAEPAHSPTPGPGMPKESKAEQAKVAPSVSVAVEQFPSEPAAQEKQKNVLESITRDLTRAARAGDLSAAIGRDKEIFEVLQILVRKGKNNVILVGEAGVGKTKIAEGLAVSIAKGEFENILPRNRVLELNIASLMSGTQYRGAFEEKILALLDELKKAQDTILLIDEIHLIMGAGGTDNSSVDLANLLKPALARGEICCIGATTLREYRKFIEKDPAIERRFQMVRVEPLSERAAFDVLVALRPSLERHHGIHIGRRALHAAVSLTVRYMPNRHLPDKAIDVLDQACARYRLRVVAAKKSPELFDSGGEEQSKLTPHDIRKVISQLTAIPIEEMTAEERVRIGELERKLKEFIVGQDEAVAKTVAAVKKSRAGLADPRRPDAVMLFLGPSGVGKTQLAKELADALFGSTDHLISFSMSEYVESHSVSRLLGAPPGYVGSEEEGLLSGAVRKNPFSIVLFDEIEKADPSVFDVLLPILGEGQIKDSMGKMVSFRNCIIIMTSNVAADVLSGKSAEGDSDRVLNALRQHFRPEFINRIDEIVPFHPLLFEDIRAILKIAIDDLASRLKEKNIGIHIYQGAYEWVAKQGYNEEFGARELRRTVERLLVNEISDGVLDGRFASGDTIEVLMEDEKMVFRKSTGVEDDLTKQEASES